MYGDGGDTSVDEMYRASKVLDLWEQDLDGTSHPATHPTHLATLVAHAKHLLPLYPTHPPNTRRLHFQACASSLAHPAGHGVALFRQFRHSR